MNKERREIELLQRALKCIGESSNEDLCGEIEVFLAQPELSDEQKRLAAIAIKQREAHGIGGGE